MPSLSQTRARPLPAAIVIPSEPPSYDAAARMAELSAATAAPAIVRDGADVSPLLGGLMVEWSDVLREEVLKKWQDPTDLALLARACWKCGVAVAAAGLVRAGDTDEVPFKLFTFLASGELLAWAKANRCPWGTDVCSLAARYGQVALQWARELDCPSDAWTCAVAARHGHLEALEWEREHGCPWNEHNLSVCEHAVVGGHQNVLQWAREQGCPWGDNMCTWPLGAGTWRYCSGRVQMGARAPNLMECLEVPPRAGTLK
jgi:hypothetical protein